MKISLITATFNSSKTIRQCIDSVLEQEYENIEHLIIDGDSSDNTLEIIKEYQNKHTNIKLISEKDNGIYDALNKGVKNCTGDVLGFLHSDDILYSSKVILKIVSKFRSQNYDGIYGDLQYVDKLNTNKVIRYWKSVSYNPKLLKKGWMPAHPTLFLNKEIYLKYGLFDLSYKISADYDFILRIFKDNTLNFAYIPEIITKMRVGGASNRSIKNIIQKTREDYRAIRSNNIGGVITLLLKNTSKIKQFLIKKS